MYPAQYMSQQRVGQSPISDGRDGIGLFEPGAERADEEKIEQPVQDDLLPRLVIGGLIGYQGEERSDAEVLGDNRHLRECVEERAGEVAAEAITGGDQQVGSVVRLILHRAGSAACYTPVAARLGVCGGAVIVGVHENLVAAGGLVGERVWLCTADQDDPSLVECNGVPFGRNNPSVPVQHHCEGQRCWVREAKAPWRSADSAAKNGSVGPYASEVIIENIHC